MNIFFKINNNKLYKLLKSLYNLFKAKFSQPLIGIILPVIILLIWYFLAVTETIRNSLLPTPNEVLKEILILANEGTLFSHIQITLTRVFYGFIGGGIAATILGILTGVSPFIRKLFDPTIQALKAVPSLAWVPLFILWFGIFENSKVALISVGVFFPVYLNLMMGIRQIDKRMIEVANINNIVLSLNDNPITNLNLSYSGLTIGNATDQTIVVKGISLNKFGALQLNLIIDGKEETKAYGSNYGNALTKAGFDIKKLLKESQ